jgi:hypothetical protein
VVDGTTPMEDIGAVAERVIEVGRAAMNGSKG